MYEDDIDAVPGERLYTIHGKEVVTFKSDAGEVFVSVGELKKHGFQLFADNFTPRAISDEQYLAELKNYLSFKARKYLVMFPHKVRRCDVEEVTNDVLCTFTSEGSHMSTPKSNNNKVFMSTPTEPSKQTTGLEVEKSPVVSNSNSRLRKPHGTVNIPSTMNNSRNATFPSSVSKPKIPDYATVEVSLNVPQQVCITHVVNAQRYYVYLKSRSAEFRDLLMRTSQEAQCSVATTPEIGKICIAQFEGEWYRAIVLQTSPLKVMYIDFGNWNDENLKEIRSISETLAKEPAEALRVNFGSNPPSKALEYNDVITITFTRQNSDKSFQAHIVSSAKLDDNLIKNNKSIIETGSSSNNRKSSQSYEKESTFKPDRNGSITNKINGSAEKPMPKVNEPKVSIAKHVKKSEDATPIVKPANKDNEMLFKRPSSVVEAVLKKNKVQEKSTLNPTRKTIMDVSPPGPGVLQYSNILNAKCICFICPHTSVEELGILDNITDESNCDLEYIAKLGDTVAVYKEDETKLVRGTIINISNNTFAVALIDYGIIELTGKVYKLSKKFLDIPEFVCICLGSKKFIEGTNKDTLQCEVIDNNKLKVFYADQTNEVVTCQRWDPFLINDIDLPAEEVIVTTRPKNPTFADKDLVVIVNFNDGKLLVRNKNSKTMLTNLQKNILNYNAKCLKENPIPNQIVLCPFENGSELHRAAILTVNGKYADVEYLDLGVVDTVLVDSLKSISEPLANHDVTLAPITLPGFEEDQYSETAFELIQKYCDEKEKFVLKKISGNMYDLLTSNKESLSNILINCGKTNRILFHNLPKRNVELGMNKLLCLNSEQIEHHLGTFMCRNHVSNDEQKIFSLTEELSDKTPYMPILDEICFAEFEGEWYRGRVIGTNKELDEHNILYIDYGNEGIVSSAGVRKLAEGYELIPPIGITCKIEDDKGIEVITGGNYIADIISCVEDVYSVTICGEI